MRACASVLDAVAMPRPAATLLALATLAQAVPASAAQVREPSLAQRYVRVTAATAAGDFATAGTEMSALLQREPANTNFALHAYRQAITGGDQALAMRAARILDAQGQLPADGPLLLLVGAVQARDWKAARVAVDRLEQGKLFTFLSPILRAWIALGARDADPFAALEPARTAGLAMAYYPEQHLLLQLATGHVAEAAAEIRAATQPGTRIRILGAGALAPKDRTAAMALLAGDEQPLVAARRRIAAGERLPGVTTPADGIAELLDHVALDFNRQRLGPVATVMARLASFVAPNNAGAWITVAQVLGVAKQPDAALAALAHVPLSDPFSGVAQTLRVSLLIDKGDKPRALDEALASARRRDASASDWARVGDVHFALDQPAEAATDYGKAIALAENGPPGDAWLLWLQQGSALELAGDWPRAKAALEKAYALAPDQPVVLNHLGYSQIARRENLPAAEALIVRASALRPDDPAITDSLGWSQFLLGKTAAAVPLLERASAGNPSEPTINEHLGDVYWTLGRRIDARYAWRAALVTAEAKDKVRLDAKIEGGLTPETASP